jgi:hypothetical protein
MPAWTVRRLKDKMFTYFERRPLDGTYLRNTRNQNEQQINPGGRSSEQNQPIHGHLDVGPHRLHTCQQRLYLGALDTIHPVSTKQGFKTLSSGYRDLPKNVRLKKIHPIPQ